MAHSEMSKSHTQTGPFSTFWGFGVLGNSGGNRKKWYSNFKESRGKNNQGAINHV